MGCALLFLLLFFFFCALYSLSTDVCVCMCCEHVYKEDYFRLGICVDKLVNQPTRKDNNEYEKEEKENKVEKKSSKLYRYTKHSFVAKSIDKRIFACTHTKILWLRLNEMENETHTNALRRT